MKPFSVSIHIFRRDLRLHDNTALNAAFASSDKVIPVFILDHRQLKNPYFGQNSFQFMLNSLKELNNELTKLGSQLYLFKGIAEEVIVDLIHSIPAKAICVNRDYTPFSRNRDESIAKCCALKGIEFSIFADALLTEPEQVHKKDGLPYTVYTPFVKTAQRINIPKPQSLVNGNFYSEQIPGALPLSILNDRIEQANQNIRLQGGRQEGLKLLNEIIEIDDYESQRNFPSLKGTSLLSAHHKFGTVSIRETYHTINTEFENDHQLTNELYWRDFFTHIGFHFPRVFDGVFREKYKHIAWKNDKFKFEKWCTGQTGFPIVDAGMRELIETGYMHNRVRMIVASFLTKDLHIDWRWGERFFAKHLIDYDPAVNNGNWQWAASTGCDAQPYFRIFNPWRQQLRFDPQCFYIKKWIPELCHFSVKEIHGLQKSMPLKLDYPPMIVDHSEAAKKAIALFKEI